MKSWIPLTVALAGWSAVLAQGVPPRGTTHVGDVAVYAVQQKHDRQEYDETVTVTDTAGGMIRTSTRRPGRAQDAEGVYGGDWETAVSATSGSRFEPPWRELSFPLEPGKAWEQTSQVRGSTGALSQIRMESRVAGQEKVSTPAGAFDTYRIEQKGYLSGLSWQGGFQVTQTVWYAPAIDRVVRREYRESRPLGVHTVSELKSFRPGA